MRSQDVSGNNGLIYQTRAIKRSLQAVAKALLYTK